MTSQASKQIYQIKWLSAAIKSTLWEQGEEQGRERRAQDRKEFREELSLDLRPEGYESHQANKHSEEGK